MVRIVVMARIKHVITSVYNWLQHNLSLTVVRRDHRRNPSWRFDANVKGALHDANHLRVQNSSSQRHLPDERGCGQACPNPLPFLPDFVRGPMVYGRFCRRGCPSRLDVLSTPLQVQEVRYSTDRIL